MGFHIGLSDFQMFQYSDSSSLAASLIYSFIVSCRYLVTVTCFSVFYFNYHCLLEFENNVCTFHMKTFLSSTFCVISKGLAYLVTSPASDFNVVYKLRQKCLNLYIPTLANQALHRKRTW